MGHMQCQTRWVGGSAFEAQIRDHKLPMDSRGNSEKLELGPTPKEVLLASICGCSGMDVVAILQKMRVNLIACDVNAETETTASYPSIFSEVKVIFRILGDDIKPEQALRAVTLSMTKYCGVSAMVVQASPIRYEVFLNQTKVGEGMAQFESPEK